MNDLALIRSFGILNRTYLKYFTSAFSDLNVSYSEGIFLVNIGSNDGISQETLAHDLAIDKAAIARAVKNLKANGLVQSNRSAVDHREYYLRLTESGIDVFKQINELNRQWVSRVLEGVSMEKIAATATVLQKMAENSKQECDPSRP